MSGLNAKSLIRLGYLIVLPQRECRGRIGSISEERRIRLLKRLSDFLDPGK
jgi:mRNA interferase MazF